MSEIDPTFIESYLLLGLRLGRHIDGLVDAYYGPEELAARVNAEPVAEPARLVRDAEDLQRQLVSAGDSQRAKWLRAQLEGLMAVAGRLDGRPIPYAEEIRRCYGIAPRVADEDDLAEAHRRLSDLLPGAGSVRDRYQAWRRAHEIEPDRVLPALQAIKPELRLRTSMLFGLPDGEDVDVETVQHEPWSGFNYYLGGLRSRVVINTDIPMRSQFLVLLVAHECYPGHHTEHALKEVGLVREKGRLEESIFLIGTPQSLVSEGIATSALGALGDEAEEVCEALLRERGIGYDVALSRAVSQATMTLDDVWTNVAFMIHDQGVSPDEARSFASRWMLETQAEIAKRIEFILHPVWRAYVVLYVNGQRLVERWTARSPLAFKRLLTEQVTASDLTD